MMFCHFILLHVDTFSTTHNASNLPTGYNISVSDKESGDIVKTYDVNQYYFQVIDYHVIQINCDEFL